MVECLIDNIYVEFGDHVHQQNASVLIVPHWWETYIQMKLILCNIYNREAKNIL